MNKYRALGDAHKLLQSENLQLREYVSVLQSCILESRGEVPPSPQGLDLGNGWPATAMDDHDPTRITPAAYPIFPTRSSNGASSQPPRTLADFPSAGSPPVMMGMRAEARDGMAQNIDSRLMNA